MTMNQVKMKGIRFSEEETAEEAFFGEGVHIVQITGTDINETNDQRAYIEIKVEGINEETTDVRMWLTTSKARHITIETIRRILVHNQSEEQYKQRIREEMQKVQSLYDLQPFIKRL